MVLFSVGRLIVPYLLEYCLQAPTTGRLDQKLLLVIAVWLKSKKVPALIHRSYNGHDRFLILEVNFMDAIHLEND